MKLWLLTLHKDLHEYDGCRGMVVRAPDEERARLEASKEAKDEGKKVWLCSCSSKIVRLQESGRKRVIIQDVLWG